MGYRIEYDSGGAKRQEVRKKRFPVVWVLLCAGAAALLIPGVRTAVWHWLLPGDGAMTAQALGELVTDLQTGEPFGEAVTVFCREIIQHGG